jgi:hypothetical protein
MTKYTTDFFNKLGDRFDKCNKTNDIELSIYNNIKDKIVNLNTLRKNIINRGADINLRKICNPVYNIQQKLLEKNYNVTNYDIKNNNSNNMMVFMFFMFFKISKELDYHINYSKYNEEYKKLISGYSIAYLSGSYWYYGKDLPIPNPCNFLSNKEGICKLYILFILFSFMKKDMGDIKTGDIKTIDLNEYVKRFSYIEVD